jgi:hypothetical protein
MLCPKCNHATSVKDTRDTSRRRACMSVECGHRFYTEERVVDKAGIRKRGTVVLDLVAAARIAELEARVAELEGRTPDFAPAQATMMGEERKSLSSTATRVKSGAAVKLPETGRPAAFFSRESLVPDMPASVEVRHVTPSWMPKLPPAAIGRMR